MRLEITGLFDIVGSQSTKPLLPVDRMTPETTGLFDIVGAQSTKPLKRFPEVKRGV
jgi:hypothetical protein